MATLEERLSSLEGLPVLPVALVRVLELLRDEAVDIEEVERAIMQDQSLSLATLRYANSSLYAGAEEITSVRGAISRIGLRQVRRLVTAHHASQFMSLAGRGYGLDEEEARVGSLAGALAAELIATGADIDPDSAFTAALLRDCGKLVLEHVIGIDKLLDDFAAQPTGTSHLDHERMEFGFDHAEAGALLARSWGLPEPIPTAIGGHHAPSMEGADPIVDVVYAADVVCAHLGLGVGFDGLGYTFDESALARVGIDRARLANLLAETIEGLAAFDSSPDTSTGETR